VSGSPYVIDSEPNKAPTELPDVDSTPPELPASPTFPTGPVPRLFSFEDARDWEDEECDSAKAVPDGKLGAARAAPTRNPPPLFPAFALGGREANPEPCPLALEGRDVERCVEGTVKLEEVEVALQGATGKPELSLSGPGCTSQGVTSSTGPVSVCPKGLECDLG